MKLVLNALTLAALLIVSSDATLWAQPQSPAQRGGRGQRQDRGAGRGEPSVQTPGVTPGDVQRMFDAYALVQAQDQLKISDEQFAKFMPRFKALQEARRKTQADRGQVILELRRLSGATPMDEAQVKEKLRALQEIDERATADLRKSHESIDQVLALKQQAQFRVFEEVMERRKLEMISRARANRPKPPAQ